MHHVEKTAHSLTVAELLALPVFERGRPEVLAGADLASRTVRWVHTSEIYEISPLLKGGEVLLTTGLGLVGAGPAALRAYATALADRSVAALVIELGRTFTKAPQPLVDEARSAGLPLITLRGIVPFVEITETVHTLLISREIAELRLARRIEEVTTAALIAGTGLSALVREVAALVDCPIRLLAADGHLVAASDSDSGAGAAGAPDPRWPRARVDLGTHLWGYLIVCGAPNADRVLVATQAASAVALELGRGGSATGPSRRRAGELLIREIFGRQYASVDDVAGRAAALGLIIRPGQRAVGICLAVDSVRTAREQATRATRSRATAVGRTATSDSMMAVAEAAEAVCTTALIAEVDGAFLIAATTASSDLRALAIELADAIDARLSAGRAVALACGPTVADIGGMARSLRVARESSLLARRLHSDMRTLLGTDVGVHRLLSRFATDPELAAFVDEQLGPLLEYDAAHGRELVRTLDTLLACGLSKAEAARALHIRRQTLYQRLETVSALLGGLDLAARERRTSIDLALVGWRLRTAGSAQDGGLAGQYNSRKYSTPSSS